MMEFTRWLILIKIVLQAASKLKKDRDEEDRDDQKYCVNKNILW